MIFNVKRIYLFLIVATMLIEIGKGKAVYKNAKNNFKYDCDYEKNDYYEANVGTKKFIIFWGISFFMRQVAGNMSNIVKKDKFKREREQKSHSFFNLEKTK